MRLTALLLATLLPLAACGGGGAEGKPGGGPTGQPTSTAPAAPKDLAWGQPATVTGHNGHQLKVTPVGVLYHRGPYQDGDRPENGWFVALALKVEALQQPDAPAAPISGGGLRWRGANQTITTVDGNATSAPWVGSVNEFGTDAPIEPGSPEVGIESFDIPTKGGRLLYVSPVDQSITSWTLPAADQGTGLDKVRMKIKQFS
jgi:hypothetical protein